MKLAGSRNTAPGTAVPRRLELEARWVRAGPSGGCSAHQRSQQPEAGRQRCEARRTHAGTGQQRRQASWDARPSRPFAE
jgi:hypothetical protein